MYKARHQRDNTLTRKVSAIALSLSIVVPYFPVDNSTSDAFAEQSEENEFATFSSASVKDSGVFQLWSDDWTFVKGINEANPSTPEIVNLPHTCNTSDELGTGKMFWRGVTSYTKTLTADGVSDYQILIQGAGQKSEVFLDGVSKPHCYVKDTDTENWYEGGYTPHTVDFGILTAGTHTVEIRCDNSLDFDLIPVSADFNFCNGLYRDVYLIKNDSVCLNPYVYGQDRFHLIQNSIDLNTRTANFSVEAQLDAIATSNVSSADIVFTLTDSEGTEAYRNTQTINIQDGTGTFTLSGSLANCHLWNGKKDPHLYTAKISVKVGGVEIDSASTRIGFRHYSFDENEQFLLNGEVYQLRGVAIHQDDENTAAMTEEEFARDYEIIDELGATMVRTAHYTHTQFAYEKADELGLIVQTEIPWVNQCGTNAGQAYRDCLELNLRSMIANYYNHTSIVFWGLSNELGGSHLRGASDQQGTYDELKARQWNNELYAIAKQLDTTRLIGFTSHDATFKLGKASSQYWDADWIGTNRYDGWYGSAAFTSFGNSLDSYHNNNGNAHWAVTEYGAGANPSHHSDDPMNTTNNGTGGARHDEEFQNLFHESYLAQIQARPWLTFTTIWAMYDFASSIRNEGGRIDINDKGLVTRDRQTKKDIFYLYKAAWTEEPMAYISSRRFVTRTDSSVQLKAYANTDTLTLYVDGEPVQTLTEPTSAEVVWTFDYVDELSNGEHTFKIVGTKDGEENVVDEVVWKILDLPPLEITQQPQDASIHNNEQAEFSVEVSGSSGIYTYQWEYCSPNGTSWGNAASSAPAVTDTSLQGTGPTFRTNTRTVSGHNGSGYRCVISSYDDEGNLLETITSEPVYCWVDQPLVVTIPSNSGDIVENHEATLSANVTGGYTPYALQWQYRAASNEEWQDISGENSNAINIGVQSQSNNGNQYRLVITDSADTTIYSDTITINILEQPFEIILQPRSRYYAVGDYITFEVGAIGGSGSYSYQWQYRKSSSGTWGEAGSDSTGGNQKVYTTNIRDASHNGWQYRCIVTDNADNAVLESTPGTLTLTTNPVVITQQPETVMSEAGDNVTFTVATTGGRGAKTYQWQMSTPDTSEWIDIDGANNTQLSIDNVTEDMSRTQYRCVITDSIGYEIATNTAYLNVGDDGELRFIKQPESVVIYTNSQTEFSVEVAGGTGYYGYQWEYQEPRKTNWVNASSNASNPEQRGTGPVFHTNNRTTATHNGSKYRCVVYSYDSAEHIGQSTHRVGDPIISEVAIATVIDGAPPQVLTHPQNVSGVVGESASMTVGVSGSSAPYTYQWQVKIPGSNEWTNVILATNATISFDELLAIQNGYEYRCKVSDSYRYEFYSNSAIVTVTAPSTFEFTRQPEDASVTSGDTATFTIATAGGVSPISLQWQQKSPTGEWEDIAGATAASLYIVTEDESLNGYQYRCVAVDSANHELVSDAATLSESYGNTFRIVQQPAELVTVYNGDHATFSVEVTGGTGIYTYQWQYTNRYTPNFTNSGDTTSNQATYTTEAERVYPSHDGNTYRCIITEWDSEDNVGIAGHEVSSLTSNVATLEVLQDSAPRIINQPQDISAEAGDEAEMSVTISGGVSPITYQWQMRTSSDSEWQNVILANDSTISFDSITENQEGYEYRCVIMDGMGTVLYSEPATIEIITIEPLVILSHPQDITIDSGNSAIFSVETEGGREPISLQWQSKAPSGEWENIDGENGDSLRIRTSDTSLDGYQYRCIVTPAREEGTATNAATLTVTNTDNFRILQHPQDVTVYDGEHATFTVVPTGGSGIYTYQWQYCTVGDTVFRDSSDATSKNPTYTTESPRLYSSHNGNRYRCIVTELDPSDPAHILHTEISEIATVTVLPTPALEITEQPQSATVEVGDATVMSVTVINGTQPYSYQWQRKINGGEWEDIDGANNSEFLLENIVPSNNLDEYRCIITDGFGHSITSDSATITLDLPDPLSIINQTGDTIIVVGADATFSVNVSGGSGNYSYQWQIYNADTETWDDIVSANDSTLSIENASFDDDGNQYRCIISDAEHEDLVDSIISETITLSVADDIPFVIVSQPQNATVVAGSRATFSVEVSGGVAPYTYQWQWANASASATFQNVSDADGGKEATFETPIRTTANNKFKYRCIITDATGTNILTSDPAILTVETALPLIVTTPPQDVSVVAGAFATFSVGVAGGTTPYTYQWQYKTPGSDTWMNLFLANDSSFSTSARTINNDGYEYRCIVSDMSGQSVTSPPATLHVRGIPATEVDIAEKYGLRVISPSEVVPTDITNLTVQIFEYDDTKTKINKYKKTETLTIPRQGDSGLSDVLILMDGATTNPDYAHYTTYLVPIYHFEEMMSAYNYKTHLWAEPPFRNGLKDGSSSIYSDESHPLNNFEYVSYNNKPYMLVYGDWDNKDFDNYTGKKTINLVYNYLRERTDTITPPDTTINLFDFWTAGNEYEDRYEKDSYSINDIPDTRDLGINTNHALRFGFYMDEDPDGRINDTPANINMTTSGIVQRTLVNGFPYLDTSRLDKPWMRAESLDYLFDPTVNHAGKKSFRNASSFLHLNEQGYYCYNSTENAAWYDEENNKFTVYEDPGIYNSSYGQFRNFFPFNVQEKYAAWYSNRGEIVDGATKPKENNVNHYFGFTMTTHFYQQYDGYSDSSKTTPTEFHFSGDDDVWIFIDDVLVGDIGGTHAPASFDINFVTGEINVSPYDTTDGHTTQPMTIREAFEMAGMTDTEEWSANNPNTFASDTTHVLKFFYLERANGNSNLMLSFNLSQIPTSNIYKIDQEGTPVAGAGFGIYETKIDANGNWLYYVDNEPEMGTSNAENHKTEQPMHRGQRTETIDLNNLPAGAHYECNPLNGVITYFPPNDGVPKTITPLFLGWTDDNGEMEFCDDDGTSYTMREIKELFGEKFLLREFKVPDGYRSVYGDAHLYIRNGVMFCDNVYRSGVWPSNNAFVSVPQQIYIASEYSNVAAGMLEQNGMADVMGVRSMMTSATGESDPYYYFNYYSRSNNETPEVNGTLFAIVLKRDDRGYADGDWPDYWYPVYGTDDDGYNAVRGNVPVIPEGGIPSGGNHDTNIAAVIEAAKRQAALSGEDSIVFNAASTTSNIELTIKNLPGKIDRYYTFLKNESPNGVVENDTENLNPQYAVAYYWTTADSLEEATADNTVRVYSHDNILNEYSGFSVQWSTTVEVPNMINRLYYQRKNDEGEFLNGSTMALYDATLIGEGQSARYMYDVEINGETKYARLYDSKDKTNTNGTIKLYDIDGNEIVDGTYTIDTDTGTISISSGVGNAVITPTKNAHGETCIGTTEDYDALSDLIAVNTFSYLVTGDYLLRELGHPENNEPNTSDNPIKVTEDGVYAYAGAHTAEYNRVRVANGAGYLSKTLDVFATKNEIDETLRWICIVTEYASNSGEAGWYQGGFDDYIGTVTNWNFDLGDVTSYLEFIGDNKEEGSTKRHIFNYVVQANQDGRVVSEAPYIAADPGTGTLWHWVENGWSSLAVFQDHTYGIDHLDRREGTTTNYDDLSDLWNISNLFSHFTMVQLSSPKFYGDIDVTCYVRGIDADTEKYFTYTVTLEDPTINGQVGDMFFEDGVATFQLKHGETFTTEHYDEETGERVWVIPSGTKYEVVQSDDDGYTVMKVGDVGEIPDEDTAHAIFYNWRVLLPMTGAGALLLVLLAALIIFMTSYIRKIREKMLAESSADEEDDLEEAISSGAISEELV